MEETSENGVLETEDYYMDIALRLTYGIPDALVDYDIFSDADYMNESVDRFEQDSADITISFETEGPSTNTDCPDGDQDKAPHETNEMHIAVFRYDVEAVEALLRYKPVSYWDKPDDRLNTPLLLATKLGFINLARMLIGEGFSCDCPSVENGFEYHLMDEAVLTGSVPLVQDIYRIIQRKSWQTWLEKKPLLLECLEKIPDFYIEIKWNFSGVGPMGGVVKMFAPDDTYKIWKRGSWLRLDSTIAGFNTNFSAKRANLSTVFRGRGAVAPSDVPMLPLFGEGDLLHIDKSDMTYQRV